MPSSDHAQIPRVLVIVTPREPLAQGEEFGNPYEAHRSRIDPRGLPAETRYEEVAASWLAVVPGTWRG